MLPKEELIYLVFSFQAFLIMIGFGYFIYLNHQRSRINQRASQVVAQADQILEQARKKALETQKHSIVRAQQVLRQAEYFKADAQDKLKTEIDHELNHLEGQYLEEAEVAIADIENATVEDLEKYQEQIKRVALRSQEYVAQKAQERYERLEKELADYKLTRIAAIDQDIQSAVNEIAKNVLNKAISLEDHHQLIIDSLEKAKKEGLLKP